MKQSNRNGIPINDSNWLREAFEHGGVDLEQLANELPREVANLADDPRLRKPDDMSRIFSACAMQTGNPHFGLDMVEFAPLSSMGIYGYLLANAPTVRELLTIGEKYFSTFFKGAQFKVTLGKCRCKLLFHRDTPGTVSPRHGNEWALGLMVQLIRARLWPRWHPERVGFANEPPGKLWKLREFFGQNIHFGESDSSLEFSAALLDHAMQDTDHKLLRILMAHGDELLKASSPQAELETQVRMLIFENISQARGDEYAVAKRLNMSVSTLKRRLSSLGLNYRALRLDIIMDLARSALRDTNASTSDIALGLGYSDGSAFCRAFSRIEGIGPLAYRKLAANEGPLTRP